MSIRVVVITGASSGVGRAAAGAFAWRGDALGLLARSETGLNAVADEVRELGGRALTLPTGRPPHGPRARRRTGVEAIVDMREHAFS